LSKNKIQTSREVKKLSRRIFSEMILFIVVFNLASFLIFYLGISFYRMFSFQTWDLLYRLAQWFQLRMSILIPGYLIIGNGLLLLYFWRKIFSYVGSVLEATESMYQQNDQLIVLPRQLQATEMKMNQIKLDVKRNEQIARAAEQRKNDLVVYLAHDLKTPLTSVIGYLTLLRDEREISEELQKKYLGISLEKAERLEDLINEFFEITRFNLSSITLEKSRVNLTRMLEQLAFEFQPMFKDKNLNCELKIAPEVYWKCDVDKMQRVFDNLLRNAVNYSFENSSIEIQATVTNQEIQIQFKNEGNTIPEEKLERIFEQFFRLDSARASRSGGAGLGLAIAKEIVELHGGKIDAFSENDQICFTLMLPSL
jgi:two-component system sensor histidine kinase VanS